MLQELGCPWLKRLIPEPLSARETVVDQGEARTYGTTPWRSYIDSLEQETNVPNIVLLLTLESLTFGLIARCPGGDRQ